MCTSSGFFGRQQRQEGHLRSPRTLDPPRLAALLGRSAPCGACVVGAGSRALALRVRQGLCFESSDAHGGSSGALVPPHLPARAPSVGEHARVARGSPRVALARFLSTEPAGRATARRPGARGRSGLPARPARPGEGQGRCSVTRSMPWWTRRARPLRGAPATARPKAEQRKTQPAQRSEQERLPAQAPQRRERSDRSEERSEPRPRSGRGLRTGARCPARHPSCREIRRRLSGRCCRSRDG